MSWGCDAENASSPITWRSSGISFSDILSCNLDPSKAVLSWVLPYHLNSEDLNLVWQSTAHKPTIPNHSYEKSLSLHCL